MPKATEPCGWWRRVRNLPGGKNRERLEGARRTHGPRSSPLTGVRRSRTLTQPFYHPDRRAADATYVTVGQV
ncbi:hypothetical protein GCM10009534_15060 [Kribbella sandramycini]